MRFLRSRLRHTARRGGIQHFATLKTAAPPRDKKTVVAFWILTPAKLLAKKPEIDLPSKPNVAWPDKKALAKLVWQKPLVHAVVVIGVSDVALKKHCVKLGIDLPPPGHWVRHQQVRKS
ncbi:MAG: hypothetical protein ACRDBP_02045 [Luteolibacter sp.]